MLHAIWSDLSYRLRALVRRDDVERELADEVRDHLDRETAKLERQGLSPAEARRQARLAFGGVEQVKEASRDGRGTAFLEAVVRDCRYAVRSLRKQPAFTFAVVATLALGIGANTTVFTLLNALLLRPLPVPHAEQLVTIGHPNAIHDQWDGSPLTAYVSYPVYADIRDGDHVFSGVYANGQPGVFDVLVRGDAPDAPEHPRGRLVSANFFSVLQVPAAVGRVFVSGGGAQGLGTVAVISDGYWRRRFGGERSAVGSTITINGVPVTIIGVTPPSFSGDIVGERTDLWLPITLDPLLNRRQNRITDRSVSWLVLMGRLAPGATLAQARAEIPTVELRSIRAHLSGLDLAEFDRDYATDPIRVDAGARGFSAQRPVYRAALFVLMAAVGLVILVVCANVSNLMLARAAARTREATLRVTLGAGRRRLAAQVLTESALLGLTAGALGLLAAVWATRTLLAVVNAGGAPITVDVHPDARILAFTAGVTLLSAVGFGLGPAFAATRVNLAVALRAQARSLVGVHTRGRRLLVVAQIALSMVLLVGAGLLVRTMRGLTHADLGLDRDHLLLVSVASSRGSYTGARLDAFARALTDRAAAVPGVMAASVTHEGIFSGGQSLGHVDIADIVTQADSQSGINFDVVGPGYFRALGATLLRGRDFELRDATSGAHSAAINQTMAHAYFPATDPIGRTVTLDGTSYTIVAVVGDVQEADVRGAPVRRMYVSWYPPSPRPLSFELVARTRGDPSSYVAPLREALRAAAGPIPIAVTPLRDRIARSIRQDALVTQVSAFFGALTLLLAALGLYGVIAYSAKQRTAELGLRVALGAAPNRVVQMILREGVHLAIAGVVLGVPLGLLAARLIRNQLFGVGLVDAPSLGVAVVVLILTALLASYLPARRAARVEPLRALQFD